MSDYVKPTYQFKAVLGDLNGYMQNRRNVADNLRWQAKELTIKADTITAECWALETQLQLVKTDVEPAP